MADLNLAAQFVRLAIPASTLAAVYILGLYFSRLYFHPLSKFPGPKLAAISNWYEFYYEVVLQGAFTAHIKDLHKKYGPILRITPTELHIDDPEYYDTLYSRSERRDKYRYMNGKFGFTSDTFSTTDHDHHRLRRKGLSPFFSAKKIREYQPVIKDKISQLSRALDGAARDGQVLFMNRAWMALTTDVISEYAFGKSYNQLSSPGFEDTLEDAMMSIYGAAQLGLHFPSIFPILDSLPESLVRKYKPELTPIITYRRDFAVVIGNIRKGLNHDHESVNHATIFHEILHSDLPEAEKSDERLGHEAQLIISAGLITTAWALTVANFHLATDRAVATRLSQELRSAGVASDPAALDWHKLEALPYLHGCVHEAMRLAYGVATRSPIMAPDRELVYGDWVIPRNTPVSMTNVHVLTDERVFPEPTSFRPERWIEDPGLERFFVPFGKGSRQCIGINLAMAELYLTMASIYSRFEFDMFETDGSDLEMVHAFLVPFPKWDSKGVRARVRHLTA